MRNFHIFIYAILLLLASCTPRPEGNVSMSSNRPDIYPDYTDVTIPVNIAPLNFMLRDKPDAVECIARCGDVEIRVNTSGCKVIFSENQWHKLLKAAAGKEIDVTLSALYNHHSGNASWTQWNFKWQVVADPIDSYLTYRLIEPDYEVWNNLQIQQRCIENFEEHNICDYHLVDNRCMNCHTFGNQDPGLSMMYVRGKGGGAILNQNGNLRKLDIKTDDMASGSVYFGFSPSGRYVVFSTNVIIPAFHSQPRNRLEVFDSKSDVYVADLQENRIISSPLLCDTTVLETFPTFSPDGNSIYYCAAPRSGLAKNLKDLQYSLVRINFNEATGQLGTHVDTLLNAFSGQTPNGSTTAVATIDSLPKRSVCHPRVSPDGRYILYTVAYYGTFPIWHREADLQMMDLQTGNINTLAVVNSDKSDTYHAWSSNSRWFVFASKRDDGLYGTPYFSYVDRQGRACKPFVLPQKDPEKYENTLKSFNVPEFSRGPVPFTAVDVADAMKLESEPFRKQ
ncbi:MAG: PD40 domain-containing protein [Prevotella sp.]|nr:PD40 domain-containing protein [Prevotella sp.]